ncbi:MAG: vitamin K epoxide reductase family protein [Chloroflexi bacterium]|nr:vitamin K epoxide reductase family protein [Chloroflexota bacterium]
MTRPERWRATALVVLAALGAAIAGYLTLAHYTGATALCTGVGGCEQVQGSRFAVVAGIPVALWGLVLYLGLLGLAAWRAVAGTGTPSFVGLALFALALAGVLYSAYLTYLELFVIGAVCPWCVASAVVITALWALATADLLMGEPAATPSARRRARAVEQRR